MAIERRVFSGRSSDTDIVVAAAKAYMFALNRLIAARREGEKRVESAVVG